MFPKGIADKGILVSLWDFGSFSPAKERSYYLCNDHPAKMRPSLARAILQTYGDPPVLDPMAGVGTTLVEAMLLGMNVIGVEYERKFVRQANKNISHAEKLFPGKKLGRAVCIQGDARDLSRLNNRGVNISKFGSILFSPPYEGALNASKHVGGIASRDPQLASTGQYSKDKKNIDNSVGKTYLSEMFKVYSECYRVLKPGKFMVVVIKDIQRNWTTIPLGADTIKLCQLVGFKVHDIIINKLYNPSFWMLNLAKKSQRRSNKGTKRFHALKSHEYVLVFRKPE